uniref:C2H2-type domain-containing protein n=1 Tax=Ananas comosus var. bracteatus TaxID=296719 RepID=A0A6V7PD06_ANACO|nr:unnamed protein product [Ananas comosus var. bracteatus]
MKRSFGFVGDDSGEGESIGAMAGVLMLISRSSGGRGHVCVDRVFECKTCNRRFPSFQALGGHRASHKKPRPASAAAVDGDGAKPKMHECSICGLEFAIGQALGGHMRRHRPVAAATAASAVAPAEFGFPRGALSEKKKRELWFDLNVSPPEAAEDAAVLGFTFELLDKGPIVVG